MTSRSRLLSLANALLLSLALAVVAFATPAAAQQTGGCQATHQIVAGWSTGFYSQVTVINRGTTTSNGWEVTLDFPDGVNIQPPWGYGIPPFPGDPVRIRNAPWNGAIPPNGSVVFYLIGSHTGAGTVQPATSCTLL